ncbi:MAG: hypothetical protein IJF64_03950 [Clostridia bacterium]|nr:hypothetical protein [Clostridia bacterium]
MKVKVKVEWQKAEQEFYKIPKEQRENVIFWSAMDFIPEKIYDVIAVEKGGWYRIIDESGEDYRYPPGMFDIVEE